jgi:hypothetical protein
VRLETHLKAPACFRLCSPHDVGLSLSLSLSLQPPPSPPLPEPETTNLRLCEARVHRKPKVATLVAYLHVVLVSPVVEHSKAHPSKATACVCKKSPTEARNPCDDSCPKFENVIVRLPEPVTRSRMTHQSRALVSIRNILSCSLTGTEIGRTQTREVFHRARRGQHWRTRRHRLPST